MGTTFAGMGTELRRLEPVFEEALQEIDMLMQKCIGWSVIEKMSSEHDMADPKFVQPALFAIQVSLFKLLTSWGIIPSDVIGHSVGEVAASYAAKRLSLEDCVKVSAWHWLYTGPLTGM
jgi:acyl transferase domain-containing protein